MTYEPPKKQPKKEDVPEPDVRSEMDKLRDYSREFEGDYNRGDLFEGREDPADWWKK